jgi:hypothetical protein
LGNSAAYATLYTTNINGAGSAGIRAYNNSSASFDLAVAGTTRAGTRFGFSNPNTTQLVTTASKLLIGTADTQDLVFGTNDSARITVLSGGNVGIGTAGPDTKLQVYGDSGNLLKLQSSTSMGTAGQKMGISFVQSSNVECSRIESVTEGSGNIGLGFYSYSNGERGVPDLYLGSSGNVGIGTVTPGKKLNIATAGTGGNIELTDTTAAAGTKNKYIDSWQGRLTFGKLNDDHTFNAEYMQIDNDGNINVSGGRVNSFGGLVRIYPTWTGNNSTPQTAASDGFLFGSAYVVANEHITIYVAGNSIFSIYQTNWGTFCIPVAKNETWSVWRQSSSDMFNELWWRPR